MRTSLLIFITLLVAPLSYAGQDIPLRLGAGRSYQYHDPARSYARTEDNWLAATSISLEAVAHRHLMARAYLYRLSGESGIQGWGQELQLLTGFGLNQSGWRIYGGPALFRELRHDQNAIHDRNQLFTGLGINLGTAWQWQRWSADFSTTFRANDDYVDYYEDSNTSLSKEEVWVINTYFSISYQL